MPDSFRDHRGVIRDLLVEPLDSVTEIESNEGAVRGNHRHKATVQYTYVVSGRLLVVTKKDGDNHSKGQEVGPGGLVRDEPGTWHAWKALEPTTCLVFTRGPRSGEGYEGDTERLAEGSHLL